MSATSTSARRPMTIAAAAGRLRVWLSASIAAVLGLLPHVLHHAGPLAGAALLGGIGGSLLFGALGLMLSIPFLLRVHRHCGNWRVPAALFATFAVVFSISTFVIGPAISGGEDSAPARQAVPAATPAPSDSHAAHHR